MIRFLTEFGMLVFFTNLRLTEFQVRYLALSLLFLSKRWLRVVLEGSLHKNIQLMFEFLKAPFLVQYFSCYALMTFLTMLSEILLYMLILLSKCDQASICGNNLNCLRNVNLVYKTLWTGIRSGSLISMPGKRSWFCLTSLITMVLLM